ncbi:MAG: hypothetical protein EOM24_20290 [Chloroflexia bacterium]|nr:hypothetical protein [Chloroflexia bacterium]
MNETRIGTIVNYYGALNVYEKDGKFFWYIEDWDPKDVYSEEIPKYLYDALMRYERNREKHHE